MINYLYNENIIYCYLLVDINDASILDIINGFIASDRLNKNEILQLVSLASISNDLDDLKDNMKWESFNSKY